MAVALILDFPGGTKQQYDEVVARMDLHGQVAPGGLFHAAGRHEGGWRVIDVWEDLEHFARFRDEQIIPLTSALGMAPPKVRVVEVDQQRRGEAGTPALVQVVSLPGLDHGSFHATDDQIIPGGQMPDGLIFHVNGPIEGGWCVIDSWTSKEARDRFVESRVRPAMENAPLQGPPRFEDLAVEATLAARERATA